MTTELMTEILKLSPAERIQLAEDIWNSLPIEEIPPTEEQLREVRRRVARADANPESGIPWEKAKEQLEKQLLSVK